LISDVKYFYSDDLLSLANHTLCPRCLRMVIVATNRRKQWMNSLLFLLRTCQPVMQQVLWSLVI